MELSVCYFVRGSKNIPHTLYSEKRGLACQ